MRSQLSKDLDLFEAISLAELNQTTQNKRFDNKFITNKSKLTELLKELNFDYKILEIENSRIFKYSNIYFDTSKYDFFNHHINGYLGRFKVRLRRYHATDENFIEVKFKNNRSETSKHRIKSIDYSGTAINRFKSEISDLISLNTDSLSPTVYVDYKRITLLKPGHFDKVTIDFDIQIKSNDGYISELSNLVIVEHKSSHSSVSLNLSRIFKLIHAPKMSISKYCLSLVLTKPGVKYNAYKSKLLTINRICNGINSKHSKFSGSFSRNGVSA